MTDIFAHAALWLGLALLATSLSIWLGIATALSEIVVGTVAQLLPGALIGAAVLGTDESWVRFLSSTGAVLLTFLAGAELDPQVMRKRAKATAAGMTRNRSRARPSAEHILYHGDSWNADHIVLGHGGKNVFRRGLMGSVSHRVISYATRTVTVVR